MNVDFRAIRSLAFAAALIAPLLVRCRLGPEPEIRSEDRVSVHLNDSLVRFDRVLVQLLAEGDTAQVVAVMWDDRLQAPSDIPSYSLDPSENRALSVRVRAWDADGRLALDEVLANEAGRPVVTARPIPQPSPRLASLSVFPGTLSPAFSPAAHAYSVSLPYEAAGIQVTAAPAYAPARLYVGSRQAGSGQASEPLPLDTGSNRIVINVIAADTTDQYTLSVLRAGPPDTANPDPSDTGDTSPGDSVPPVPGDSGTVDPPKTPADTAFAAWKYRGLVVLRLPAPPDGPSVARNFPLLLRLDAGNFDFGQAADSGRDLRFMTPQGKVLDYAVARWDAKSERAEVFILCDSLSASGDPPAILAYWGDSQAAAAANSARVFPAASGWSGVWHLEEAGSGRNGEYRDAAGLHNGTGAGGYPARIEGIVGGAQDFDGHGSQGWIVLPEEYDPGAGRYSLHLWVYNEGGNSGYLFIKSALEASDQRFAWDLTQGNGRVGFASGGARIQSALSPAAAAWTQLGIVCDGDSIRFYANGIQKEVHPFASVGDPLANALIGARNPKGDFGFPGRLDEIWSYSGTRDAWYMRLIYENQKPGSTLATLSRL